MKHNINNKKKTYSAYRPFDLPHGPELEVTSDGERVRRIFPSRSKAYPANVNNMKIRHDKNGEAYVLTRDNGRQRVDFMVATCYVDNPDGLHLVRHKDGDPKNCRMSNLEWISGFDYNRQAGNTDWGLHSYGVEVSREGEVRIDEKKCTPICYISGGNDLNYDTVSEPEIKHEAFGRRRVKVEDLVAQTWLEKPQPRDGKIMALTHLDGDYRNCKADNLKWVEADSREYLDYAARRDAEIAAQNKANRDAAPPHLLCHR